MLDDRTDALFPLPDSSAGKLLKHLVARQIPGTPIEARTADVARGASLRPADASAAMAKLADDGLILVEPGVAADAFTVTVLLAPPLEEFGITPEWADAAAPATAIPPAIPAPGPDGRAARPVAARTDGNSVAGRTAAAAGRSPSTAGPATTRRGQGVSNPDRTTPAATGSPSQAAGTPRRGSTEQTRTTSPPARRGRFAGRGPTPTAQTLPLPDTTLEPAESVPTKAPAGAGSVGGATARPTAAGSAAATRPAASRRGAESSASVDETALVRGFVERFERLLAEIDEWKRRARDAEDRAGAAEKRAQAAERRVATVEGRLAAAQERLSTWADLTRRMQQLSRQADGGARPRPPAASSARAGAPSKTP